MTDQIMTQATTPEFRVAYPAVFTPKRNMQNTKDEWSLVALFNAGTDFAMLQNACTQAIVKALGPDQTKWPQGLKFPFRDQGDRAKPGSAELPDGYVAGNVYVTLKTSSQQPRVVDGQLVDIIDQGEFYGGCWAVASVNAYYYDNAGNRGVALGLNMVQKVRDDKAFGNRMTPEQAFTPVAAAAAQPQMPVQGMAATTPAVQPMQQVAAPMQAPLVQPVQTAAPIVEPMQQVAAPIVQPQMPAQPMAPPIPQGQMPVGAPAGQPTAASLFNHPA